MWTKLKSFLWQWRGVWIAAPSVTGLVLLLRALGVLQTFELALLDQFFILRPSEKVDDRILIVDVTEDDIRNLKQWPMADADLAKLVENIKAQQPRAIGIDIYRDLQVPPSYEKIIQQFKDNPDLLKEESPTEPGYKALLDVFQTTPNLFGIRKVTGDPKRETVKPPPGLPYPDRVAANDLPFDADGKVRRFFINIPITKDIQLDENDTSLDGLGVKLALKYLEAENIFPEVLDEKLLKYKMGKAVFVPFNGNDGGYIKTKDLGQIDAGYQLLINYLGPKKTCTHITLTEVLNNQIPANLMRDKVILIGASALSLNDLFYTPYSSTLFKHQERMPGVEIHANIVSQLLNAAISGRPATIETWDEHIEWLWILAWSVAGASLAWSQRDTGVSKQGSPILLIGILLGNGALVGSCYLAFLNSWWIPLFPPFLGMAGSVIGITAYVAKTAGDIRKTFGRYLTDDVVATLLENPEGAKLGGERRKITIFTSDLRGFTATAERLPPEKVVEILNIYLGYMADIITEHKGTIDEFMGDGILVLFGAPTQRDDDAERAVACAIAMQLAMPTVNKEIEKLGLSPLKMGIGINTGEVVVGNIGSTKRTKYGVVGSQVNLTYRIESYTTDNQILISESTKQEIKANLRIDGEKQVQPKGVKEPITIYDVGGIGEPYNLYLTREEEEFFPLLENISFVYAPLDGKQVSGVMYNGHVVELSAKGAKVIAETDMPPLTNIKLNFLPTEKGAKASGDVYAKVTDKKSKNEGFYLFFTAMPPEVEKMIGDLYKSIASKT